MKGTLTAPIINGQRNQHCFAIWAMLVVLETTPWSYVMAAELSIIEFSPDHRTEALDVPGGQQCSAMLDDESNFSVAQTSDHSFQVSTDGNSSRAALLLISCNGLDRQYALQYSLTSNDMRTFGSGAADRPAASLGASVEFGRGGMATSSLDYSDHSYLPFGYTARRSLVRQDQSWNRTDSIDVAHDFGAANIHYGYSVSDRSLSERNGNGTEDGRPKSFRMDLGAFGNIIGGSRTTYGDGTEDRQLRAYVMAPISLRLSDNLGRDFTEERRAERTFFVASRTTESILTAGIGRTDFDSGTSSVRSDLALDQKWNRFGTFRPKMDSTATCDHGERCYSQSLGLGAELQTKTHLTKLRYAPYPHQLSLDHRFIWGIAQELDSSLVLQFEPLPWATKRTWIAPQNGRRSTTGNSFLHLETKSGRWVWFVDHTLPWYNSDSDNAVIQQITSRWGTRYESDRLSWGAVLSAGYGHPDASSLVLDLRYYLDQNVARFVERSQKKRLTGKTVSEATGEPIAASAVRALRQGEVLAETVSNELGEFTLDSIGCCGEVDVEAESAGVKAREKVLLAKDRDPEQVLLRISDLVRVPVNFFIDTNSNGKVDAEDDVLSLDNASSETGDCVISIEHGQCRGKDIWLRPNSSVIIKVNEEVLPFRYYIKGVFIRQDYKLGSGEPLEVLLEVRKEGKP